MRILLASDYDRELILEDDITSETIYQELTDRAVEIDVSIQEVSDWLETDQQSLVVAQDFGDIIQIVKEDCETRPTFFVEMDCIYDTDDLFNQVVDYPLEVSEIDMDIGNNPYDEFNTHADNYHKGYERLRRWVESHPVRWHKLTFAAIAAEVKLSLCFVYKHLPACVISAKYVSDETEYKQKRKDSRGYNQVKSKPNPTIAKIHEWLKRNYTRWQSMTIVEISEEAETSQTAVYNNLPKLLLADGFVANLSEYNKTRKLNRGYKGKKNHLSNYIVEVI